MGRLIRVQLEFPAYRYVPGGEHPHPLKHPDGHRCKPIPKEHQRWFRGLDLFDAGYYWEAHELLEGLWLASTPGSADRHLTQAIIQWSAAILRFRAGDIRSADLLNRRVREHFDAIIEMGLQRHRGLHIATLRSRLHEPRPTLDTDQCSSEDI